MSWCSSAVKNSHSTCLVSVPSLHKDCSVTCLGCSVGWDTWTGLKRLRYSLTIPVQLSAWINFPFQKNAAISRNALWLSYLDPPLQLQQGSSLFIFFSKQHGECSWTESWCAPLSCAPLMSGAVGMVSEKVPHLGGWCAKMHCGKQLQPGDLHKSSNYSQVFYEKLWSLFQFYPTWFSATLCI